MDPVKMLNMRLRQKMYLARYGRISPFEWENRDINELRSHYDVLSDIISEEHTTHEDR